MGIMKIVDKIIRILLIIMIVISIILSMKMWHDIGIDPMFKQEDVDRVQTVSFNKRSKKLLLLPANLYLHHEQNFILASCDSNLKRINKELAQAKYSVTTNTFKANKNELLRQQQTINSLEYVYLEEIDFNQFLNTFSLEVQGQKPHNFSFNRLVINAANGELSFFNTKNNKMCILSANHNFNKLYNELLNKNQDSLHFVQQDSQSFEYVLSEDVDIPKYRYSYTFPSYTVFTKAFFGNSGKLTSRDTMDNIIFYDKANRELQLNEHNGIVNFDEKEIDQYSSTELQDQVLNILQNLGNEIGDLRFYDAQNNTETFRVYVENYPVFGSNYHGMIQVKIKDKNLKLFMNQKTMQVPLPMSEKTKLLSTEHVDEQLRDKKVDLNKITNRQIGYTWNEVDQNTVIFEPKWYLQYEDIWYSLDDLLNNKQGDVS